MLIQNNLPEKYNNSIEYIYNYYKNKNLGGKFSEHFWIDDIKNKELKYHLNRLRNANEIKDTIKKELKNCDVISSHNTDEVYLSVSPSNRNGSDITLSDCHYDAPFKYVYQGGCKFLRLILALNENKTVYTKVEEKTSLLSKGDYNIIDYNNDYHCVYGSIPKNKDRIMLKLHYISAPYNTNKKWIIFCKNINNWWTHFSRNMMRDSINPKNLTGYIKKYIVLLSRLIWNYMRFLIITLILITILMFNSKKISSSFLKVSKKISL